MTDKASVSLVSGALWCVACLALTAGLASCGPGGAASPAAAPPEAAEPDLGTIPTPIVLSLAYQDDFMDQASGWDDAFDAHTSKQYGAHRYHINVDAPNLFARGLANRDVADFVLEVTTKQWEGPDNNSYGIIFRYQDKDNFYRFDITGDGFFLLSKFVDGQWLTLVDWTASPAIQQGQADNKLRVSALGPRISVYANGELMADVEDSSFRQGDIGFFAGTFDQPGVHISFDDLRLWTPPGAFVALKTTPTPVIIAQIPPTPTPVVIAQVQPTPTVAAGQGPTPALTVTVVLSPTVQLTATPQMTSSSGLAAEQLPEYVSAVQPRPRDALTLTGKIAYPVFDAVRRTYDTYVLDFGTGRSGLLLQNASGPAFSPSGKYMAYRSWDAGQPGLLGRELTGTQSVSYTVHSEAAHPAWSPSEDSIFFHSRHEPDRLSRLYRARDGRLEGILRNGEAVRGQSPAVLGSDALVYAGCLDGRCGLVLSRLDGGAPRSLTDEPSDTSAAVSPDGQKIAFMSRRSGNWDVYVMQRDGSAMVNLTPGASNEGLPAWSPDGREIAFLSDRNGSWGLWVMNADGSNQYQVLPLYGSPDGLVRTTQAIQSADWTEEQLSWSP